MPDFLFESWTTLGEIALTALLIYAALVILLRVSGKRTLAKFNAFDFVVTVAIGSMIATTVLDDGTSVAAGVIGIATLIVVQMLVSYGATRSQTVQRVVKSQPRLLFHRGTFLRDALVAERVTTEELRLAARDAGYARLNDVLAIVLETAGTISVISTQNDAEPLDAFADVNTQGADISVPETLPPSARWDESRRDAASS